MPKTCATPDERGPENLSRHADPVPPPRWHAIKRRVWTGGPFRVTLPSRRLWAFLTVLALGLLCLFRQTVVPCESIALHGHKDWITALHFSPDGRTIFASGYHTIASWELGPRSARSQAVLDLPGSRRVAIGPDGSTVAVENQDGTLMLLDGCAERTRSVLLHRAGKSSTMSFRRDGSILAAASSEGVRLWDITTGRKHAQLSFDSFWVTCLEFAPDGRTLAVGGSDGEIRLFDVTRGVNV
jgi:WD40 repeat protein